MGNHSPSGGCKMTAHDHTCLASTCQAQAHLPKCKPDPDLSPHSLCRNFPWLPRPPELSSTTSLHGHQGCTVSYYPFLNTLASKPTGSPAISLTHCHKPAIPASALQKVINSSIKAKPKHHFLRKPFLAAPQTAHCLHLYKNTLSSVLGQSFHRLLTQGQNCV